MAMLNTATQGLRPKTLMNNKPQITSWMARGQVNRARISPQTKRAWAGHTVCHQISEAKTPPSQPMIKLKKVPHKA
jgi:hypothetical protein